MKTLQRHLIIIIFLTSLLGVNLDALAVTINLVAETGGKVCYRIGDSGDYTTYAQSYTIEASVGAKVYIFANTGDTGYSFSSLTASSGLTLTDTSNPRNKYFTVAAGHNGKTITATYTLKSYTLTLTSGAGGSVSGSSGLISYTTPCTVTATPGSGYMFFNWTDARGEIVSNCPSYSFTMPAQNWSLTANFIETPPAATPIDGYYYFDLAAGDVIITTSYFRGYRFDGTNTPVLIAGTHSTSNKYYVYQSQNLYPSATDSYYDQTGYYNGSMHIPSYPQIMVGTKTWSEYITNNNNVNEVIDTWNSVAPSYYRVPTGYHVDINGGSTADEFTVVLDNICSNYNVAQRDGSVRVNMYNSSATTSGTSLPGSGGGNTTLKLKGDNRLVNLCYVCTERNKGHVYITSFDGDGATTGSLTTTDFQYVDVPGGLDDPEHPNHSSPYVGTHTDSMSILGSPSGYEEYGLTFNGGTVFAGCPDEFRGVWPGRNVCYPVCVGGGGTMFGEVIITGGNLTAVSHCPGPAIGGGGGYNNSGGNAEVTINGTAHVYAYGNGIYSTEVTGDISYEGYVASTAIGGSSTFKSDAMDNTIVSISGNAYVYAESVGGVALGGGSARDNQGGSATVNISGNAEVVAVSKAKTITVYYSNGTSTVQTKPYNIPVGNAIGGGNGTKGADGTITIAGSCVIQATSIGGGNASGETAATDHGGDATVEVSGGTTHVGDYINNVWVGGKIGGGSAIAGYGGNASIYVTNGTLDCASIGGGNSESGAPGTVTHSSRAGVQIEGGTVTTGSIGGGVGVGGSIGKATAYISGGTIQGQFVLSNTSSTPADHCTFTMVGTNSPVIDNTNLGTGKYVRAKDHGGAIYMQDNNGEVTISGGTIQNASALLGGAVFMSGGHFTISGTGKIQKCLAHNESGGYDGKGGAVYMDGGTFTMNGGTLGGSSLADGNTAVRWGGALFMAGGSFTMNGGTISYNQVTNYSGGGVYVNTGGTADINGGSIQGNEALNQDGGGIYVNPGASVTTRIDNSVNPVTISGNKAQRGAGAFIASGLVTLDHATISGNIATNYGGGLYMAGGTFTMESGNIEYNQATNHDGGGIYIATGGTANIFGGTILGNEALKGNGGGLYVDPERPKVTRILCKVGDILVSGNKAKNGGGIYVKSGKMLDLKVRENDGDPTGTSNIFVGNIATEDGGGIYVTEGTVPSALRDSINVKNIFFENNIAGRNGGAICANGSHTEVIIGVEGSGIPTGYFRGNSAQNGGALYANAKSVDVYTTNIGYKEEESEGIGNTATQDGGGIYTAGGEVRIMRTGAIIQCNTAGRNGGGIYANNGTVTLYNGHILSNRADCGGGIYANGGTINFTFLSGYSSTSESTYINYNTAATSGGGLYVSSTGRLNMWDDVTFSKNHVPVGEKGGGIYLEGVISIGATSPSARTILVEDNFAAGTVDTDPDDVTVDASNRNNVYLPHTKVSDGHTSVITVVKSGLTTSTRVGFSVPRNYVPVIYCAYSTGSPTSRQYLQSFLAGKAETGAMYGTVFDDTGKYTIVYGTSSPYHPDYLFLSGGAWVERVTTLEQAGAGFVTSDGGNTVTVSTPEALAYVISYVNGLNDVTQTHTNITIKLANDINIGAFGWTPIAGRNKGNSADLTFTGIFDGQGHTISNLYATHIPKYSGDGQGLFGILGSGAQVKNVCLKEAIVTTGSEASGPLYLGGIAKKTNSGATVSDCVTDVTVESVCTTSVMGGLVGSNGGTIQNCVAIPEMTGYQMGGLVGANSGNIYNSYANPKFTYSGSNKYYGGLVGVNTGTVENCYARVQGTAPATTYFGYLAGNNAGGTLQYSYAPVATYVSSNGTAGTQTGLSTFGVTLATAYNYHVRDNQVDAVNTVNTYAPTYDAHHLADYQLKKYLNKWVDTKNGSSSTYAGWTRPTTQTINGDYPLLKLTSFNAVGATSGDASLNYGDINSHLTSFKNANQAICLYGSKSGVNTNVGIGTAAPLYIDEDAVLTQTGAIQAYVGVTLDNSACHNGANPSLASPGYTDNIDWHFFSSALSDAPIGLEYPSGPTTYGVDAPQATFTLANAANGYFPTNLDNYYGDWDFYAYYEPDYHWINLKRNSESHWHEDWPDINIPYLNESTFTAGKGYLVALKEEGYLQAYGTLNTHQTEDPLEVNLSYTPDISWTTRQGHNLLGNPYQSYLDFDAFAAANTGIWNGGLANASYIIMDEDQQDYVLYAYDASENTFGASRYLHPHQGFIVVAGKADLKAKFHDGMRSITGSASFRSGDRPNYPLVNLFATDDNGNRDMVTVELGRPDKGGALKQSGLRTSKGSLSCHYEDEDYALVFTQPGLDAANIRFATDVDCAYTMTWNTQNGKFSYLHLIDNMTGTDIDCLTTEEYKFNSRTSDYKSRFRLVFDYTGVEENGEDVPSTNSGPSSFAFQMGNEVVVNGEGRLEMIDLLGRIVKTQELHGNQNTVSIPSGTAGVYVLRLENGNGTQVQKIVVK